MRAGLLLLLKAFSALLTFSPSFPLPSNTSIPKGCVEHQVFDFSIISVAASRAEGLSQEDLCRVVSFREPSDSGDAPVASQSKQANAEREGLDNLSDLSDFEYAPGSDFPAFRRDRCSQTCPWKHNADAIQRHSRDFPDQRKRIKLSKDAPPPSDSSDATSLPKRQPKNRDKRRTAAKYNDRNRKAETLTSMLPAVDASKFNISNTGWQGKNPRGTKNIQGIVDGWESGAILIPLGKFLRIPHEGSAFLLKLYRTLLIPL